jgi:hypothetical protein
VLVAIKIVLAPNHFKQSLARALWSRWFSRFYGFKLAKPIFFMLVLNTGFGFVGLLV